MKTVGQIIRNERLRKNLTIEQLSHLTKIDPKYLVSIEEDNFSKLPSETFVKGFVRNIALRLDRDPNELIAIFRRDYKPQDSQQDSPKKNQPIRTNKHTIFQYLPYLVGIFCFLFYLAFQFRAVITPPKITINKPVSDAVLVSPIEIEGTASIDAKITINEDTVIRPDENGNFSTKLNLPLGEINLLIKSSNRFGRSITRSLPITIISK